MVKEILQLGDKRLTTPSKEVDISKISSPEIQKIITNLLDTCHAHDSDTAGLSAVQIGTLKRIYVARRIDLAEERWDVMINPQVKVLDSTPVMMWEGCMSIGVGDKRLFGPVYRPNKVEVTYFDSKGNKQTLVAEGYMAHIVQHEQDHLNGKLFLQYVSDPGNIWQSKELDEYVETYGHYPEVK